MAPSWLTALARCYLGICFACASVVAYDVVFNHWRQPMGVMNFVFPITAATSTGRAAPSRVGHYGH